MPLLFLSHVLYSTLIDWLIFKGEQFDWFPEFHIALSEIVLTACADQLICNLGLTKFYIRHMKTKCSNANSAYLLFAKWSLFDLVGQRPSSLIINFEPVIKSFLV